MSETETLAEQETTETHITEGGRKIKTPTMYGVERFLRRHHPEARINLWNCHACLGAQIVLEDNPEAVGVRHGWDMGTLFFTQDAEKDYIGYFSGTEGEGFADYAFNREVAGFFRQLSDFTEPKNDWVDDDTAAIEADDSTWSTFGDVLTFFTAYQADRE